MTRSMKRSYSEGRFWLMLRRGELLVAMLPLKSIMSEVKLCVPVDNGKAAHQCYMVACHAKAQTILGDRLVGLTLQSSRAMFSIVDCSNDLLEFDIEHKIAA